MRSRIERHILGGAPTPVVVGFTRRGAPMYLIAGGAQAATASPGVGAQANRPQPTTTNEAGGGPFQRYSRQAQRPGYQANAVALGGAIDLPLSAAPGYLRYLDVQLVTTGGATGGGLAADTTEAEVANFVAFWQVKDAYGTPVFTGTGFGSGYLVQKFSGQVGLLAAFDPKNLPSRTAAISAQGNGATRIRIPFEVTPTYGCLAIGNASLQPTLHIQVSTSAQVFSSNPTTLPTLTAIVDEGYWTVPNQPQSGLVPPGLGTTLQWTELVANPTIGSGASQRVQFPRVGGFIRTIILVARDNTGARVDAIINANTANLNLNKRIRLYLDGVPVRDESIDSRLDQMAYEFPQIAAAGTSRPAGVIAYSFGQSESQMILGQLDTLENVLSTTPGTLIEVEMTPWGNPANAPYTLTAIVGAIVPRGDILQGIEVFTA